MRPGLVFGAITLVLSISLAMSCGEEADLGVCPPASDAQQAAGEQVLVGNCLNCHSSKLTGADRQDAPDDLNFDDLAVVRGEAGEIYGEAAGGSMPPSPYAKISGEALENFRIWLACGAKDTTP